MIKSVDDAIAALKNENALDALMAAVRSCRKCRMDRSVYHPLDLLIELLKDDLLVRTRTALTGQDPVKLDMFNKMLSGLKQTRKVFDDAEKTLQMLRELLAL